MGKFQEVLASANTWISRAIRGIASKIDTSSLGIPEEDISGTNSEGAGVGYAINDYGIPQTERGRGKNRIFHFFNPSAHDRREPAEISLWNWPGDLSRIEVKDAKGNVVKHQLIDSGYTYPRYVDNYWGNECVKVLIDVNVPAYGYSTYVLYEKGAAEA